MSREKQDTHIVIVRRIADEDQRWEIVGFAKSQQAAVKLAKHPDGRELKLDQGDILAAGPIEIANPMLIGLAKVFVFNGIDGVEAKRVPVGKENALAFWEGPDARGDVMIRAAAGRVDDRRVVLAVAACAAYVLDKVKDDPYPAQAIDAARAWALGIGTKVAAGIAAKRARSDLWEMYKSDPQGADATSAAASVAETVQGQASAFWAVSSAAAATGDRARGLVEMAEIVRKYIPTPVFLYARAGIPCPLPIPRDNPRRRR